MLKFVVEVRVRKQDRNGNTYHDVTIYDAKTGECLIKAEKRYGYGRHYEQTTADLLNELFDTKEYEYGKMDNFVLWIVNRF